MDVPERKAVPASYAAEVDFTLRVPTRGGLELGATLTRPASDARCPALVWYDPYRAAWDGAVGHTARYFAERGYAFVNLHARGTGNSEGVHADEYTDEETRDGYDAVEWLAAQPWCTGAVGMLGSSYSGFTCLQVAALAPPSLRAIAPAYFTDRRYTDDCHYKGGCLRGYYDTLTYGLNMVARNALPPHPRAVGERWAELWERRLAESEPYLLQWLAHPVEDDYWARGSVVHAYDRIRAAAFLIGGWHDGYLNPPLRVFRALPGPKRLLMGPWSHTYPDASHCGPRIDIQGELLRWWDRWLKGIENGVDREPRVLYYVQEFEPPRPDRTLIAGRWHAAEDLPAEGERCWHLGAGTLEPEPPEVPGADRFPYVPAACRNGGLWDAGVPFCLPGEQRPDEALAVNYTSEPLDEDLVLFGQPSVTLTVSADAPVLPFAFRLCEVGEDGTSVLVTRGILNATRRSGMEAPEPLEPGKPVELRVDLEAAAWRFRRGHRVRLSVNGSDFPNVWPTPYRGTGTLHRGPGAPARLVVPVCCRPAGAPFRFRPSDLPPRDTGVGGNPPAWRVVHDVLEDRVHFVMAGGNEFCVSDRDPAQAYTRARSTGHAAWPGMAVSSEATAALTSDERAFHLTITLRVRVNDTPHYQRRWHRSYARRLL